MAENQDKKVVTRFAPSPTGKFHVGGIRSALYNYLFARKHDGVFILRSEDTDPVRSKKEFEDYFLEVFSWLGLEYDQFFRQSERTAIYKTYIDQMIADGKAYVSKEEVKKEGDRPEVIRFKNPNKEITFHDEVLGDITFDTTDLGDFVIARDFDSPLYHLTVVVDDFEMGVTHVIRGQEHVSNTPRQILLQEAIGAPRPIYAHASVILNQDRAKLSKRDPLVRPALEYRDEGYLPEAMLNFMALLGWNPGTEQEVFTLEELVDAFSLERMQAPGAIFNPEKLEWINREHIKRMPAEKLNHAIESVYSTEDKDMLAKVVPLILERINTLGDIKKLHDEKEFAYFFEDPVYAREMLFWKNENDPAQIAARLGKVVALVEKATAFDADGVKSAVWEYAEQEGRGSVLWPMRVALSGREKSTDPFTIASMIGKEETLKRLSSASGMLS